jgi:hypothetical protein
MRFVVKVNKFYDTIPVTEEPKEGEVFVRDPSGKILKRVLINVPSETEVNIPEAQIQSTYDNFKGVYFEGDYPFRRLERQFTPTQLRDYPGTFEGIAAWHLFEKVMPLHAPVSEWGHVSCDDKKLAKFLNNLLKGDKK